jgi:hypothetical protein
MQESFDKVGDSQEIRFISDAIINLYAAYVNSLLYPYNHPLISDSLKNAFSCLQKFFRRKPNIRLDTAEGGLTVDGEALEGDTLVLDNFASWLRSRNIKSLSFAKDLSRRELISFHRIISTTKVGGEELSKAMSDKSITNITVHSVEFSAADAGPVSSEGAADGRFIKDYVDTMFHIENSRAQAPFFSRPRSVGPYDEAATYGLVKDYLSTRFQPGSSEGLPPLATNFVGSGNAQQAENAHYVQCVESLIEHEISEEDRGIIQTVPPLEMAHLLNAMLFKPPGRDVVDRIVEAYLGRDPEVRGEASVERCRLFLDALKSDLRPLFEARCASLCRTDNLLADQETGILLSGAAQVTDAPSAKEGEAGIPPDLPAFVPCRALESSDFVFDFVANGKAVLHDIEIPEKTAGLFGEAHLSHFQEEGVLDTLLSGIRDAAGNAEPYGAVIAECADEAISDVFSDVILDLLGSNSLDGEAFLKLEERVAALVELLLEKSDFEKILEVFNCLKTHSLQGKWATHSSAMLRNIFSSDKLNAKVVQALQQYGRKRKESASKLTLGLRSYLVPYLLDALGEETDASTRRFMMTLLTSIGSSVLEHIARRLRDSRWYVLRNMIYLLRECRGRKYAPEIKNFLEHEVPVVRLEALRTLLSFQDLEADSYVIKFLMSDVLQLRMGAIRLSGAYRIKTAVSHLIRLLQEKDVRAKKFLFKKGIVSFEVHEYASPWSAKKFLFKKGIVRALGRIGDGHAVSHLLHICKSKSVLRKDEFDHLKTEIFRTLHNYPVATIGPLIDYGMHSNNKEVVAICKKLINQYSIPGKTGVTV